MRVVGPCEAPVRLGCSIPLLNAFMGKRRGSHRLPVALYGTSDDVLLHRTQHAKEFVLFPWLAR